MNTWNKKQEWHKQGNGFTIVIKHSTNIDYPSEYMDYGNNRWFIYCYIYPKHKLFDKFNGSGMWQDSAVELPLHGGPSYLKWHYDDDGLKTSVQVGCDYSHLYDEEFSFFDNLENNYEVLNDAEKLFNYLSNYGKDEEMNQ